MERAKAAPAEKTESAPAARVVIDGEHVEEMALAISGGLTSLGRAAPPPPTPRGLVALQAAAGNRAVQNLVASQGLAKSLQRVTKAAGPEVDAAPGEDPLQGALNQASPAPSSASAPPPGEPPPLPPRPGRRYVRPEHSGYLSPETKLRLAGKAQGAIHTGGVLGGLGAVGVAGANPSMYANAGGTLGAGFTGRGTFSGASTGQVSMEGAGLGVGLGGIGAIAGGYFMYSGIKDSMDKKDRAKARLGRRGAVGGAAMLAGGGLGVALGAEQIKQISGKGGANAAFGLMAAAGALSAGRGLWKFGKAAHTFRKMGDVKTITPKGDMWLAKSRSQQKNKMAVAGLKTVTGGLGATAGGLLASGNALGWAFGIAGAVLGGISALGGLYGKIQQHKQDHKEKEALTDDQLAKMRKDQNEKPGRAQGATPKEREEIRKKAAAVAAGEHSNLQVAQQIKLALHESNDDEIARAKTVADQAGVFAPGERAPFGQTIALLLSQAQARHGTFAEPPMKQYVALDAKYICEAMNVQPDEVRSGSGADLIQQKLSAAAASG